MFLRVVFAGRISCKGDEASAQVDEQEGRKRSSTGSVVVLVVKRKIVQHFVVV